MKNTVVMFLLALLLAAPVCCAQEAPKPKDEAIKLTVAETEKAELLRLRRENFNLRVQNAYEEMAKQEADFIETAAKAHGISLKEYGLNPQGTAFVKKGALKSEKEHEAK